MAIPFSIIQLDRPRKIRFGMGAMVEFEKTTGIKLTAIGGEMSMDTCAKILWIMLKQDEKELTLEGTLALIDDCAESIGDVMKAVTNTMEAAFKTNSPNGVKPKK